MQFNRGVILHAAHRHWPDYHHRGLRRPNAAQLRRREKDVKMDIYTIYLFITNSELGAAASIIGVIITVGGFIWTIKNTKAARDAAREAVEEIQQSKTIIDISTAIQILEEIRRLHREKAWAILPDRYTA